MTVENRVKSKLKAGGRVFGTWSMLASPVVMNVIGQAGMDFIIIDMEHGPMTFETAENQIYAAEAAGCTPIIRLGEGGEPTILHALEIGIQSLLVSHVSTAEAARGIVRAARYYPEGERGLSPFTRRHGYSDVDLAGKMQRANEQMLVGVLVEGEDGIRNLDAIAAVPGLDLIYVGVYDISQSVGAPGDLTHPKVIEAVRATARAVEARGLVAGSVARDQAYLHLLYEAGYRFISYRADSPVLRDGFASARRWFDELAAGEQKAA